MRAELTAEASKEAEMYDKMVWGFATLLYPDILKKLALDQFGKQTFAHFQQSLNKALKLWLRLW